MPKRPLPAAALGLPTDMTRAQVEMAISRLLDLLDAVDGDADLEGDDPDLEDEEDDDTIAEPCLGSLDRHMDQRGWGGGSGDEREFDASEREANGDEQDETGDERDGPDDNGLGDADGAEEQHGLHFQVRDAPRIRLRQRERTALDRAIEDWLRHAPRAD